MLERDPESAGEFEWKKIGKKEERKREKYIYLKMRKYIVLIMQADL